MQIPTWSILKAIANSKYATLSVFTPIVGWLLLHNNSFASYLEKLTGLNNLKPVGWQIHSLYIGLFVFGLVVLFIKILCPKIISLHGTYNIYWKDALEILNWDELMQMVVFQSKNKILVLQESSNRLIVIDKNDISDKKHIPQDKLGRDKIFNANIDLIQQITRKNYDHYDQKNLTIRFILIILTILSFIFNILPSLFTLYLSLEFIFQMKRIFY